MLENSVRDIIDKTFQQREKIRIDLEHAWKKIDNIYAQSLLDGYLKIDDNAVDVKKQELGTHAMKILGNTFYEFADSVGREQLGRYKTKFEKLKGKEIESLVKLLMSPEIDETKYQEGIEKITEYNLNLWALFNAMR